MILKYKDYLVSWIQEEVKKANKKGVIVGISGGVDSAVVSTLAKEAFPNNSLGVIMPIFKMNKDYEDAKSLVKKNKIELLEIDLTKTYEELKKATQVKSIFSKANIKPRLRMTCLYSIAQEKDYLVLGTDNQDEWLLGYFTKYGDGGVDLLPIFHLTKGEVKEMAKEMDLPEVLYTKKPTAALWEGQFDEEELGFSYDEVDKYIKGYNINENIKQKIIKQIKNTQHKRDSIPTPKSILEIINKGE